jgi:hypothetical protein
MFSLQMIQGSRNLSEPASILLSTSARQRFFWQRRPFE